ncbi:MAG: hypothetical protein E7585_05140 [Ruminococcaceae bacterium]|nr:hypothetical protein [Oscillospiraceae bacterium]
MSAFSRFVAATKRTVKKISNKTEEAFDSAANSIKIKNLEMKMDELYEDLGRIVYRDLHTDDNLEEQKMQIVAEIDGLFDRIAVLKEENRKAPEQNTAQTQEAAPENTQAEAVAEDTPAEEAQPSEKTDNEQ